jgi:hypothetical protein
VARPDRRKVHKRWHYIYTPCLYRTGEGYVRSGPDETRERSLCSNTGYTTDPLLTDDWNDVTCPACLAAVWHSSPASKATVREHKRVTDAVAVVLKVKRCHRSMCDGPHIWNTTGWKWAHYYCPGGSDA